MRIKILLSLFSGLLILASLPSCSEEKEEFTTEKLEVYMPASPGKYITYRLDSMLFTNFGTVTTIRKYQVKHVVDSKITDNLGRPSYRVYVYLRDSVNATSWTPAQPWSNAATYFITPVNDQVEVIENNLRFIKLHLPIKENFSWKGNKFLPFDTIGGVVKGPYHALFSFNNDDNMNDWDYYYDGGTSSFNYRGFSYADVQTVEQIDESFNVPIVTNSYAYQSRSVEKYAKNIGMVYREHTLWEYQVTGGAPRKEGFGVTMWMIDHN